MQLPPFLGLGKELGCWPGVFLTPASRGSDKPRGLNWQLLGDPPPGGNNTLAVLLSWWR